MSNSCTTSKDRMVGAHTLWPACYEHQARVVGASREVGFRQVLVDLEAPSPLALGGNVGLYFSPRGGKITIQRFFTK